MTRAAPAIPATLQHRRILVVEDEYMIAEDTADLLVNAGVDVLGPVATVAKALTSIATEPAQIDAALLDVNLRGEAVWPVVDALLARKVPVVLLTGYEASDIPQAYARLPRCEKPAAARDLTDALARALAPDPVED